MIADGMDNIEGEAVDIFSQVREREKRLEINPFKTTQPNFGTLQKAPTTQSALPDTTSQTTPHGKIIVPSLRPRKNMHSHKTGPISTEEVGEILNLYSSFIIVDPPLSNMGVLFPTTEQITIEVPDQPYLNFIENVPIRAPV